jgi:hypothetical protein
MRTTTRFLVFFSTLIFCAGPASADDIGGVGPVAALQINTTSADTYLSYHGRAFVKNSVGGLDEYRWGGVSCGSRVLTDAQVAALQGALDNKRMRIEPISQAGQGPAICLVGFNLVLKQYLKLVIP